jgi:hypothetical protein
MGQGRDNAIVYLREHPEITAQVEQRIMSHHGIGLALAADEEKGGYSVEE